MLIWQEYSLTLIVEGDDFARRLPKLLIDFLF